MKTARTGRLGRSGLERCAFSSVDDEVARIAGVAQDDELIIADVLQGHGVTQGTGKETVGTDGRLRHYLGKQQRLIVGGSIETAAIPADSDAYAGRGRPQNRGIDLRPSGAVVAGL